MQEQSAQANGKPTASKDKRDHSIDPPTVPIDQSGSNDPLHAGTPRPPYGGPEGEDC